MRSVVACCLCLGAGLARLAGYSAAQPPQAARPPSNYERLKFLDKLDGRWEGTADMGDGKAAVARSIGWMLDKNFLTCEWDIGAVAGRPRFGMVVVAGWDEHAT